MREPCEVFFSSNNDEALVFIIIYTALSSSPRNIRLFPYLCCDSTELNHKRKLTRHIVEILFVCFPPTYDRDAIRYVSLVHFKFLIVIL